MSKKKRISLDTSLLMLLCICLVSSVLTFRQFRSYRDQVEETMKTNLETMSLEHSRRIEEFRVLVNSALSNTSVVTNDVSVTNVNFRASDPSVSVEFRRLPQGLKIVRVGDWFVSDGVFRYGLGDVSPVGLITNICCGTVWTDVDRFVYVSPSSDKFVDWRARND